MKLANLKISKYYQNGTFQDFQDADTLKELFLCVFFFFTRQSSKVYFLTLPRTQNY